MKFQLLLAVLLISTYSFSQSARPEIKHTERGMKMVGVQLQLAPVDLFSSETALSINDYSSNVGILSSPNIGWFVEKNWLLGGMVHLGFYNERTNKNDVNNTSTRKAFDAGITPFTRYYIDLSKRGNIKVFLQAGLPVIYSTTTFNSTYNTGAGIYTSAGKAEGLSLYGTFGFGASIHGRFGALEMNISNLGLNLGFQKFIAKKAKS